MAGPGSSDFGDMFTRFERLAATIADLAQKIHTSKQDINIAVNLGKELGGAGTPSAQARVLGKVLNLRMGGRQTSAIAGGLQQYQRILGEYGKLRERRIEMDRRIRRMRSQLARIPAGARAFTGIPQRMAEAARQRRSVVGRMNRLRRRATTVMGQTKGKASRQLGLTSVVSRLNLAVTALAGIARGGAAVVGMGRQVTQEYGLYSGKGVEALQTEFYGNLRRTMRISNAIGQDMVDNTKAYQKFMDKLEPITTKFNKMLLQVGTAILEGAGGAVESVEKWMNTVTPTSPLQIMKEEYEKSLKDVAKLEKQFQEKAKQGMNQADKDAINKAIGAARVIIADRAKNIAAVEGGTGQPPAWAQKGAEADTKRRQAEADKKANADKLEAERMERQQRGQFARFRKQLRPGRFRGPFASTPEAQEMLFNYQQRMMGGMGGGSGMPGQPFHGLQGFGAAPGQPVQGVGGMNQAQRDQQLKAVEARMEKIGRMEANLSKQKSDWFAAHGVPDAEGKLHLKMGPDEAKQYEGFLDAGRYLRKQRAKFSDELNRLRNMKVAVNEPGPSFNFFMQPRGGNLTAGLWDFKTLPA